MKIRDSSTEKPALDEKYFEIHLPQNESIKELKHSGHLNEGQITNKHHRWQLEV